MGEHLLLGLVRVDAVGLHDVAQGGVGSEPEPGGVVEGLP
jgi:hypothetical protein